MSTSPQQPHQPSGRELALGSARAAAGATLFAMPLFLTQEMWTVGVVASPWRLVLIVVAHVPVLLVLVRHLGFRDTAGLGLGDHVADAMVAYGVGAVMSLVMLVAIGVVDGSRSLHVVAGLVAVQAVPASMGAAIARSQVATQAGQGRRDPATYPYEILLMAVGCAVFAFNVAPTEEIVMLAGRVGDLQAVWVAVSSMVGLHLVVYGMGFRGQHRADAPVWSVFLGYTVVGYAVTVVVCAGLLWVFGHLDRAPVPVMAVRTVILAVPGTLGAGAARLLL